jgi:hypothetical protein
MRDAEYSDVLWYHAVMQYVQDAEYSDNSVYHCFDAV